MAILVTGCAGFIGYHLSNRLLQDNKSVIGIDNLNNYYDVNLKNARLNQLKQHSKFQFHQLDLGNRDGMDQLFKKNEFEAVINLGAQAGVRYSLTAPYTYIDSNLSGFAHILEGCRHHQVPHLIFASSSSVYGSNEKYPFSETDCVDHPVSLYAASKKANELMAHSYAHLFQLPCTGLRFFTVYGPWGRPDMALFKFTEGILNGTPIEVFNHGNMSRDFTYIDDIVEGIMLTLSRPPQTTPSEHQLPIPPYRIYNIGSHKPIALLDFIATLERILNKKAIKEYLPLQPGDVPETYADISALKNDFGYQPKTSLEDGIKKFVNWYLEYYAVSCK